MLPKISTICKKSNTILTGPGGVPYSNRQEAGDACLKNHDCIGFSGESYGPYYTKTKTSNTTEENSSTFTAYIKNDNYTTTENKIFNGDNTINSGLMSSTQVLNFCDENVECTGVSCKTDCVLYCDNKLQVCKDGCSGL